MLFIKAKKSIWNHSILVQLNINLRIKGEQGKKRTKNQMECSWYVVPLGDTQ